MTVQADHIHFIIRIHRRSQAHNFLRVIAGQIAQRLQNKGLAKVSIPQKPNSDFPSNRRQHRTTRFWKWRPYTRMIIGYMALKIAKDYLQLNELEGKGKIAYQKNRLKGLAQDEIKALWDG